MAVVAVLGTGIMGAPMARNLLAAGHEVRVWNRSREKAEPLAQEGAHVAAEPSEAAAGAELVLTMLADADAVLAVAEAFAPAADGGLWVQMSTIGLEGTARCASLAAGRGLEFVDAPVLGTKQPAEQGRLVVLASGPDGARKRCAPVFDVVGARTLWLGAAGEGTRLKLVVNTWILAVTEGMAETLALAEGLGVDPRRFLEAVEGGPLDLGYLRTKAALVLEREFPPSFTLALAAKDARLAAEAARAAGLDLPLPQAIAERLAEGVARGHGEEDMAATWRTSSPARTDRRG